MSYNESNSYASISELKVQFGLTARALRFYEDKGLLSPKRDGQKRLYSKRDRARVKLIVRGKKFGFSLNDIQRLLDLYDIDDSKQLQMRESYKLGCAHLDALKCQREELSIAVEELETLLTEISERMNQTQ